MSIKTSIGWCDHTINPVKGLCPMNCRDLEGKPYCYARSFYHRFRWDPTIRYDDTVWHEGPRIKPGERVFVGSTIELFGHWVKGKWISDILDYCESVPSVTFMFLTKLPENLARWNPWPRNCWVGATATDDRSLDEALDCLFDADASVHYVSIEPLLGPVYTPTLRYPWERLDWVIIGARTQPLRLPARAYVDMIIRAADTANIPVFMKDSLKPLYPEGLRQEVPDEVTGI